MKHVIARGLLTALAPLAAGCNRAAAPPRTAVVLLGEGAPRDAGVSRRVEAVEEGLVLAAVFPRRLDDASRCPEGVADLAAARAAGAVVPRVVAAASGAFTEARADERAYLVLVGECNASHAEGFGSVRLVVMRAGRVVAGHELRGGSSLERVLDVDGDGRVEAVLAEGFTGQGNSETRARLVRVGADGLEEVRDFGEVFRSGCASAEAGATETVTTVTATREGGATRYDARRSTRACPGGEGGARP